MSFTTSPDIHLLDEIIEIALREDTGSGDITTQAVYTGSETARASFVAKQDGIIAGLLVASRVFQKVDPAVDFQSEVQDGDRVQKGMCFATARGPAGSILTAERTVLNFLQRMSGIATTVRAYADAVAHTHAKILDTRKTVPGHRYTDKWAVRLGGGENHRIGLYDRYLIKENHIRVAGGIPEALNACIRHRKLSGIQAAIEIEITNLDEFDMALATPGADYIMLDNMSLEDMAIAVQRNKGVCKLEASGNVNLNTVASIAETGIDYISVGSITHSVQALDISLLFQTNPPA
jgi:nicotinate-nucleotide pyrophosphorylase (carboxylating)